MRPSEEERTDFPPGETVNVLLAAKLSPVRVLPLTRHFGAATAEAEVTVAPAIPPPSATIAATLNAILPFTDFSSRHCAITELVRYDSS